MQEAYEALQGYAVLCALWGTMFCGIMFITNLICGDNSEFLDSSENDSFFTSVNDWFEK